MKKTIIVALTILLFSFEAAYNQQVFKLSVAQAPPLILTLAEEINASLGEVINLDAWYTVEGGTSFSRVWEFRNGSLLQTIDNPLFTVDGEGVFYLTVMNENGCTASDSVALHIITGMDDIQAARNDPQSIRVFPNPNTGTFDITITGYQPGYSIEIMNSLGAPLIHRIPDPDKYQYSERISMPGRKPGIYYLLVKNGSKIIYRQKIIILN